jgi:hypothetical protein
MVPTVLQAAEPRDPLFSLGRIQSEANRPGNHKTLVPGVTGHPEAIVSGNEIASGQPQKRSSVTGKIVANDEHTLILQDDQGQQKFDVRDLAFQRSVKSGEEVTIQMKGDGQAQQPSAIYLAGASQSMGPIASEPTP